MTSYTAPEAVGPAPEWALVDVETSGLRAAEHRVLSVAVITVDAFGERTGEFSTLLDPGCDPGPVEIHGLTPERLRGAPRFEQVAGRLAEMFRDRVMVAHNAQFDYDFLAREFGAAGVPLPVTRRLCTVALNRRIGTPTDNLRLGTLAAFYGVRQLKAHDALDDTRVLAGCYAGRWRRPPGSGWPCRWSTVRPGAPPSTGRASPRARVPSTIRGVGSRAVTWSRG